LAVRAWQRGSAATPRFRDQAKRTDCVVRRRSASPSRPKPPIIIAQVAASGTAETSLLRNSTRRPVGLPVRRAALTTLKVSVLLPATNALASDEKLVHVLNVPPEPLIVMPLSVIDETRLSTAKRPANDAVPGRNPASEKTRL